MQKVLTNLKKTITNQLASQSIKEALQLLEQQNYRAAKDKLEKLIPQAGSEAIVELNNILQNFVTAEELQKALLIGEALTKAKGTDFALLNLLGDLCRKAKDPNKAKLYYKKALDLNPNFTLAMLNYAAVEGDQNLFGMEVKNYIEDYLKLKSFILPRYRNDPNLEDRILDELKSQGVVDPDFQRIAACINQEIQDNWLKNPVAANKPATQSGLFNLGLFALKQRRGSTARKVFERLENQEAPIPNLQTLIGISMFYQGEISGAIELLEIQREIEPENRYILINLALMYFKEKQPLQGYINLIRAKNVLKAVDGEWDAYELFQWGASHFNKGDYRKALSYLKIIAGEYNADEVDEMIANSYIYLGQPELALGRYQRLLENGLSATQAKMQLLTLNNQFIEMAQTHLAEGNHRNALSCIENALKIKRTPVSLEIAISIHEKLFNKDEIAQLTEELKHLKEQEEELHQKLQMQKLLKQGKDILAQKNISKAIEVLEKAYNTQRNAECFQLLTKIYTQLKHQRALTGLKGDWANYVKSQMKHHKYQRDYRAPHSLL